MPQVNEMSWVYSCLKLMIFLFIFNLFFIFDYQLKLPKEMYKNFLFFSYLN